MEHGVLAGTVHSPRALTWRRMETAMVAAQHPTCRDFQSPARGRSFVSHGQAGWIRPIYRTWRKEGPAAAWRAGTLLKTLC